MDSGLRGILSERDSSISSSTWAANEREGITLPRSRLRPD